MQPTQRTAAGKGSSVSDAKRTEASAPASGTSKVALPGRQEVDRVVALLAEVPEVDLAKVHRIREQVASGTYRPDTDRSAEKLIEESFLFGSIASA